jgi:YfiH family protein
MSRSEFLQDPLLAEVGVDHGFGLRELGEPAGLRRSRQVHGISVTTAERCEASVPPEADAIVSQQVGVRVAVTTADCLPILLASESGHAVVAAHAGWRGLAAGVIGAAIFALRERIGESEKIVAAIGPHIGLCCFEVDEPVLEAMAERFSRALPEASRPTRPGHARLDLARLAQDGLIQAGVDLDRIGFQAATCTACDSERFHSYRRDGAKAGRLFHFIAAIRGQEQG